MDNDFFREYLETIKAQGVQNATLLAEIKEQTTKTNGRVGVLERESEKEKRWREQHEKQEKSHQREREQDNTRIYIIVIIFSLVSVFGREILSYLFIFL